MKRKSLLYQYNSFSEELKNDNLKGKREQVLQNSKDTKNENNLSIPSGSPASHKKAKIKDMGSDSLASDIQIDIELSHPQVNSLYKKLKTNQMKEEDNLGD